MPFSMFTAPFEDQVLLVVTDGVFYSSATVDRDFFRDEPRLLIVLEQMLSSLGSAADVPKNVCNGGPHHTWKKYHPDGTPRCWWLCMKCPKKRRSKFKGH